MTFSNPLFFLVFLPASLMGYWLVARLGRKWMVGYLALTSLIFYAAWSRRNLAILLTSIAFNFLVSSRIALTTREPSKQSAWLTLGIAGNLAALCFYKYLFPFLEFTHSIGLTHQSWGSVTLPLGISFFTFTQIAYLIDLKQSAADREQFGSYALFVTFFPHLIAGPILHHEEMMPQFSQERSYRLRSDDFALGLSWFIMGFGKKTLIADRISPLANLAFNSPGTRGAAELWVGTLLYSMQLYFDFSGYSDMAIGLARMFSIRFPMNFNSPFKAENVIDFWNRWHMTLTRYIMAYVYAPMQMRISSWRLDHGKKISRKAQATVEGALQMIVLPTMVTLVLAGIWHGAGWQFLLYGVMHGLLISINHVWRLTVPEHSFLRRIISTPVSVVLTYLCVAFTFVMFHATSLRDAFRIYAGMFGKRGYGVPISKGSLLLLLILFFVVWLLPNTQEVLGENPTSDEANWSIMPSLRWSPSLPWLLGLSATFALCMAYSSASSTFLYFQF